MINSFYENTIKEFSNLDYKSYMREYLGRDVKYLYDKKYYFIACEFMAMSEEFDRFISNERGQFDPTCAFLRNSYEKKLSNDYAKCLKNALAYKYELYSWSEVQEEIKRHSNYSAQHWIDEYKILDEEREVK